MGRAGYETIKKFCIKEFLKKFFYTPLPLTLSVYFLKDVKYVFPHRDCPWAGVGKAS